MSKMLAKTRLKMQMRLAFFGTYQVPSRIVCIAITHKAAKNDCIIQLMVMHSLFLFSKPCCETLGGLF